MELQVIQQKIFEIRGCRVMLDYDLADLYQVETKVFKQAVKRNLNRFPSPDFMFELTHEEYSFLRSQIVTLEKTGRGKHSKYSTLAFTELGTAMASSILRSEIAIEMNISIMRAFVQMRQMLIGYEELRHRIEQLEQNSDIQFNEIYQALTELASQKEVDNKPRTPIGYVVGKK